MTNKISFAVENAEVIDNKENSNFAVLSLDFFASGDNLHNMYVSERTLLKTADTIKNCPLVWAYDEKLDDVYTHTPDEVPCGFVPETSMVTSRILPDGRTMLSVVAYIWKRYTGELLKFFRRDGGKKPVSVEMIVHDMRRLPNEKIELLDFHYEGITILGSFVEPAIPLATANVLSFAKMKDEYMEDLEEEFPTKYIDMATSMLVTFPYKNMDEVNPAIKGISPAVTLAQANSIAKQADAIGVDGKVNGWAVAISSFKKTHEVKDGRWVRKAKSMSEENENMSDENSQEIFGQSEPEKEEKVMEEEKIVETVMAEETSVEVKSEASIEPQAETQAVEPEESFVEKKDEELEKEKEEDEEDEKDFEAVIAEMSAKVQELSATIERMAEESKAYASENEELRKFKAGVEESQKLFAVEKTLRELEEKVIIPEEAKEQMIADAANYSIADIKQWETLCKAKSFDFTVRENKEAGDVVKRAGLPFGDVSAKSTNDLWK